MWRTRTPSTLGLTIQQTEEEKVLKETLSEQDPFDPDFLWETVEDRCLTGLVKITPQEEKFCLLYALKPELYFDAYECYLHVFADEIKWLPRKAIVARAKRLLEKVDVNKRINQLLHNPVDGLSDEFVDRHLYFLIAQNADANVKLRAIEMFKKEKGKFVKRTESKNLTAHMIYSKVVWDPSIAGGATDSVDGEWDEIDERIHNGNQ